MTPDERLERKRKYNRQWMRDWAARNPELKAARNREWAEKNPEKLTEYRRNWVKRNIDKARKTWKRWRKDNPAAVNSFTQNRRARLRGVEGTYTAEEWRALCAYYSYKCLRCGRSEPLTVDHVVPIVKGGRNSIDNIQPLCLSCNSAKGTKIIDYREAWMAA